MMTSELKYVYDVVRKALHELLKAEKATASNVFEANATVYDALKHLDAISKP